MRNPIQRVMSASSKMHQLALVKRRTIELSWSGETASPSLNAAEPTADECGADKLARWLNVLPTSDVRAAIEDAVGHDRIRYIEPGDVVTMDLRADRLNIETGVDGRIKLFRCG